MIPNPIQRILVPTDFNEFGDLAVKSRRQVSRSQRQREPRTTI